MLKKTMTYTDYNGEQRTEDFYFNLTRAEVTQFETSVDGGLSERIKQISQEKKVPAIMELFQELILRSYGQKSPDGRRFIKNKELTEEFSQTEAYSDLYMELATNSASAAAFINGIMPADMKQSAPALEIVD